MASVPQHGGMIDISSSRLRLPTLEAWVFTGAGLAVLLIGSWVPDDRLNVGGLPLDIIILSSVILISTLGRLRKDAWVKLLLLQAPIMLLLVTLLWSPDPDIGLDKLTTALISASAAFVCFNTVVEKYGERELVYLILCFLGVFLACALVYKAFFGFFNRQVVFLLNGPIVFGRWMCIATLLALFAFQGRQRKIAVTIFFLAVVWTESKGPLIAVIFSLFAALMYRSSPTRRTVIISAILILVAIVAIILRVYDVNAITLGRLGVLLAVVTGDFAALESRLTVGSLETRVDIWKMTIEAILANPLGVGIGGWDYHVDTYWPAEYPHNLVLELWCEGGILLGTIALIPFVAFLFGNKNLFWYVAFALLIAQLVSGDIGDGRFLLTFSFLALLSRCSDDPLKYLNVEGGIEYQRKESGLVPT